MWKTSFIHLLTVLVLSFRNPWIKGTSLLTTLALTLHVMVSIIDWLRCKRCCNRLLGRMENSLGHCSWQMVVRWRLWCSVPRMDPLHSTSRVSKPELAWLQEFSEFSAALSKVSSLRLLLSRIPSAALSKVSSLRLLLSRIRSGKPLFGSGSACRKEVVNSGSNSLLYYKRCKIATVCLANTESRHKGRECMYMYM